jgi:ribosome maturation factor RimP
MKQDVVRKVMEIAERVGAREGIEIVEAEVAGSGSRRLVRIYIDKPGGVTHADCESISEQVGAIFDVEDTIPGAGYTLEVSSPGVERKLRKPADFERFSGQKAKLVLREAVGNSKHHLGTLRGIEEDNIRLELDGGEIIRIPLTQVDRANLKFEW